MNPEYGEILCKPNTELITECDGYQFEWTDKTGPLLYISILLLKC